MASQEPVIAWAEDHTKFFDLRSMGTLTEEEMASSSTISMSLLVKCRTWWNTNIPMDDFVPAIIPAFNDDPLKMYFKRVRQRMEGVFTPVMPQVLIRHGIMEVSKDGAIQVYLNTPDGFRKFAVTPISDVIDVKNEATERVVGTLYWNGQNYE